MKKINIWLFVFPCLFLFGKSVFAQPDLTTMSMEDLMNIQVYSAAKKPEPVWDTAAAITVITSEDIRRSGATNIPELLRMVPGIRVEQVNANTWDISIRGFNGSIFANKLLVLIDGRSVYTPLYGGVIWNVQDVVLPDVDRIEVIRGPGGTLYGANAVNGVINIITKKAKDTQGGLVSAGGGSDERGFSTVRYGGKTGNWDYRVYSKYDNYGKGFSTTGSNTDGWNIAQGGFRADRDKLTIQGDYFNSNVDTTSSLTSFTSPYIQTRNDTNREEGWNLLTNYVDDDWNFKTYWDVTNLRLNIFNERRDQIDMEYNRLLSLSAHQDINWGLTYHLNLEKNSNTDELTIQKPSKTDQVFSTFVQDEIKFLDDKLKITLGSKFEDNIYTGFEFEPNVRALYHLNDTSEVWAAASRAIRTPSRLEESAVITASTSASSANFERLIGYDDLESEKLMAFELGYRDQVAKNISYDLDLFSDYYHSLSVFNYGNFGSVTDHGFPVTTIAAYVNGAEGEVHGAEISGDIKINEWWKMTGYYSFIKMDLKMNPNITDIGLARALNTATPLNASYLRSSFDLPHGFQFDATFRYMSSFDYGSVPSDPEVDLNLSKQINKGWRITLAGQNLIDSHHKEATSSLTSTQVRRSWYVKLTYRF